MQRIHIIIGSIFVTTVVLTLTAIFTFVIYTGPRMQFQPKIDDFSAVMLHSAYQAVPAQQSTYLAVKVPSPLGLSHDNTTLMMGKVYYHNYCQFCHGEKGGGDGPVGQSYLPVPANLASRSIRLMPNEELARRMVQGVGHEPVLAGLVDETVRGYIALYVKQLSGEIGP